MKTRRLLSCFVLLAGLNACGSAINSPTSDDRDRMNDDDSSDDDDSSSEELAGTWTFGDDSVFVEATKTSDGLRTYFLQSTHPMREGGASERSFTEQSGDPVLRSGVLLTDALFAMAVEEARQNSVSEISDAAFGSSVPCECYTTGELWNWVWTRDIAYATELGLAWLDPQRAANSLLFKLSELKSGGELQIVQDTGTGGSWPVSTDRVAWARGAMAVLRYADHPKLRSAALEAMSNTAMLDRRYAFDSRDGLYRGETSFLDWREQTYPSWMADNVVHIGMSKALSTNLDHLFLLRSLEALSGEDWEAEELAASIDDAFWDGSTYRSYLTTELDPRPAHQQDLLATSLAVLDLGTHPEALTSYPQGPFGPPVIWPQQQLTPIYHNRAIWPFVTAYSVLAARAADNRAVLDAGLDSLIRAAALNLSHMENLEVATGANHLEDGEFSGPVVNSRRQLWSVAGFLGAVAHGVFGLDGEQGAMSGSPLLPGGQWFLPGGSLRVGDTVLELGEQQLAPGSITRFETEPWTALFGARSPSLELQGSGESITLSVESEIGSDIDVYRDGELVATDVGFPWADTSNSTSCYTATAYLSLPSQPSPPVCWWGDAYQRIQSVQAGSFDAQGGVWSSEHGREHYGNWGAPTHSLSMQITPQYSGDHLLQVVYGNGAGGVDTGITAAVKWLTVHDVGGLLVAEGPLLMPHRGEWANWGDSNFVPAILTAGQTYTVVISDGRNMSYLAHYIDYVGGRGGGDQSSNDVNIAELKVLFLR